MRARTLFLALGLLAGCTRAHYREQADRETYPIIAERVVFPSYDIGRTRLEPAPGSRLEDPFDPDRPPKPPDDPAAARFMARPGGLKGARGWEKDGVTDQIEPPGWEQALGLDERGTLTLDAERSVEVALLNSRDYQTNLEAVYLQALALTLNRFEFDVMYFARNSTTYTHFGSGSSPTETNTLRIDSDVGFSRNFAAGGQLLVDFANNLVIQFTGEGSNSVRSNIAITLIQPLLRTAGRKFRLEVLTQGERDTLYAVRDFARFRKQFWAGVAVLNGGYLDLLLAVQTLRNTQANLQRQEETYRLYSELFRGGRASVVELDQFFQSLQAARQSVTDAEAALQSALDTFKLRLGLPPRFRVELDDGPLRQFVLTDPALDRFRDDLDAFQRERLKDLDAPPPAEELRRHFATLRRFADMVPDALGKAADDVGRFGRLLERPARPGDDPEQRDRIRETFEGLKKQLPEVAADLKRLTEVIDRHRAAVTDADRAGAFEALTQDVKLVLALLDTVVAVQTQARIYLIELPEVEVEEAELLAFAKANRLDLQNQLGTVTDAWRRVTVAANILRTDLDVVTTANIATDPDSKNPFDFSARASTYTAGLQFDGPLNRLAERNAYRASLILYQQARRAYIDLSDQVEFQVREDLRQLTRLRVAFEVARQQLLSAARQFENARLTLLGPRDRRGANDTTTLNLLQALSALLAARNALVASFINYEQQRIQLLIDSEVLQLDQRGFPVNASPQPSGPPPSSPDPGPLGGAPVAGPAAAPGRPPGPYPAAKLGRPLRPIRRPRRPGRRPRLGRRHLGAAGP